MPGANNPVAPPEAPMVGDASNQAALKSLLGLGLTGVGIGAGARALVGLKEMLMNAAARRREPRRPAVIEVGVPEVQEEEEAPVRRGFRASLASKMAQEGVPSTWGDWFKGRTIENPLLKPWVPLGFAATGIGSVYGGYKGVDKILSVIEKKNKQKELDEAKDEYRRALVEQYATDSPAVKRANTQSELGRDLDELYHLCKDAPTEKQAEGEILGGLAGWYAPLAALLAGGAGLATYNWAKARTPDERLAKAIKQRERFRWATRPPEIYAVAKPIPVRVGANGANTYRPGSEEDEDMVRKVASLYKP
jgi:hypothetical protein